MISAHQREYIHIRIFRTRKLESNAGCRMRVIIGTKLESHITPARRPCSVKCMYRCLMLRSIKIEQLDPINYHTPILIYDGIELNRYSNSIFLLYITQLLTNHQCTHASIQMHSSIYSIFLAIIEPAGHLCQPANIILIHLRGFV